MMRPILALSFAAALCAFGPAQGDRSVNGTGETLRGGDFEAGASSVAYGVSDALMIKVPSLALLVVGSGRAEIRQRRALADRWRLSPHAGIETPRHAAAGADLGWDLGARRQHSLTAGLGGRVRIGGGGDARRAVARVNFEYDYYHAENLAYAGVQEHVGYVGYTWAWEHVHLGLITSPASGFLPLPYVYWRF